MNSRAACDKMGSLPNLSDLSTEKLERRLEERERILARDRIIERDFGREKESIRTLERPVFIHKQNVRSYNHSEVSLGQDYDSFPSF